MVFGSLTATWLALASRAMDPELVALAGGVIAGGLCFLLERFIPFEPSWNVARQNDTRLDALHGLVSLGLVPALVRLLAFGWLARAAQWLGALAGRPEGLWPRRWPLALQLVLALLVSELGGYLAHRGQHTVRWLWPVHAIHHDANRVYFLNGLRLHPGDTLFTLLCAAAPMVLLGAGPDVLALFSAIANAQLPLQHANADLRLGPLNYVVSGPELHRWHHSRVPRESNSNYGGILIVWDLLLGTYFRPRDRRPPADVGLRGGASLPQTWWAQLWWPLRPTPLPPRE
jgi:sterol desaturase/sphingolipid hydroxylase (fatty acid hydroxylase superfamily)